MNLKDWIKLLRITQWYKNLIIFLPIIFAQQIFNFSNIKTTIIGFFIFCLISSSSYIINDIKDRKKDCNHPEKKSRPIAAKKISPHSALFISSILLFTALLMAIIINKTFFLLGLGLYVNTVFIYTFFLKKEPIADLILIAINYIIRAVSGAIIINVKLSPWLLLCTFFLGLFLATSKRTSDFFYLNKEAQNYKKVFKKYNQETLKFILIISTCLLILSYSLYSFFSQYPYLMLTLPFALYTIIYFTNLVFNGSMIPRRLELLIYDNKLLTSIMLWAWLVMIIIY